MKLFQQTQITSFFIKGLVHVISKLENFKNNYFSFPQQMCFCDIEFRDINSQIQYFLYTDIQKVLYFVVSYPVWLCTTSETLSLRWHLRIAVLQCLGKEGQLFSLFCFIPTISPSFFNYFLQECFPLNKITFLFKKIIHSNTILGSGQKMAKKAEKSLLSKNSHSCVQLWCLLTRARSHSLIRYIFVLFSAFSKRINLQI